MPAFIVWIAGALGVLLKHLAGRIMVMLGLQAVTIVGLTAFLTNLKAAALEAYGGLPATMIQVLGLLRIDQAVLVIFAALAARVAFQAISGSVTRIMSGAPPAGQL